jgi:hypothetical protein
LGLALLWLCPAASLLFRVAAILPPVHFGSPYVVYVSPMMLAAAAATLGSAAHLRRIS